MKTTHTRHSLLPIAGSSPLAVPSTHAANIWDGGGADDNITTPGNWDDNNVNPLFPALRSGHRLP